MCSVELPCGSFQRNNLTSQDVFVIFGENGNELLYFDQGLIFSLVKGSQCHCIQISCNNASILLQWSLREPSHLFI